MHRRTPATANITTSSNTFPILIEQVADPRKNDNDLPDTTVAQSKHDYNAGQVVPRPNCSCRKYRRLRTDCKPGTVLVGDYKRRIRDPGPRRIEDPRIEDPRTPDPGESRTQGPRTPENRGRKDRGPKDPRTQGPENVLSSNLRLYRCRSLSPHWYTQGSKVKWKSSRDSLCVYASQALQN